MTSSFTLHVRKHSKDHAAPALHRAARMKVAAVALLLALPALAHAQTSTGATMTCTNSVLTANVGMIVPTRGMDQSIASNSIQFVFDGAECQCHTSDIDMQLQLTMGIPASMSNGALQVWVGTACNMSANRVANSQMCEQVNSTVTYANFVTGSPSAQVNIRVPIPSDPLFSPNRPRACTPPQLLSNDFWLLFAPTGDFSDSAVQVCSLNLQQNTQTPQKQTGITVSSGDGAVTLSWTQPNVVGEPLPFEYQILCADANGLPIPGQGSSTQAYSVCINNTIIRRNNYSFSGSIGGVDGGTTTAPDLGTASVPFADGITTQQAATDGGATTITNSAFATTLDPAFLCSGEIKPTGTNLSARIDGLTNNAAYQFVVLAIDQWGNAIPSDVLIGTPQATEDLYKRYRDEGGTASGFCFIATAAFGSYEDRYVHVLRDFRDQVLLEYGPGRAFVDWYYAHSPPLAAWIAERRAARIGTQMLLWPVIGVAALVVYTSAWQKALLVTLAFAWLLRRRMRKAALRA
jgi:hypothetical protein